MVDVLDVACAVLAGGASQRFGIPKGGAEIGGRPMIATVLERLRRQTSGPVAINGPAKTQYGDARAALIPDVLGGGLGPLAGIHAAMRWAEASGYRSVLTAPVDTPFLPEDLIVRLSEPGAPSVAESGGRRHPVCGFWPVHLHSDLEAALKKGTRAVHAWADRCQAVPVSFEPRSGVDPFFNINTPEDLDQAQRFFQRAENSG